MAKSHASALIVLGALLAGCGDNAKGDASMFFQKQGRTLAEEVELTVQPKAIEIQPPVEAKNTVQYVTLAIPGVSQWRSGKEPGTVSTPDGQLIRITVDLETTDGRRFALRSASFGKDLMFSHLNPGAPSGASDLPKGERFVRLWLQSSVALTAHEVRWSDVTNK